jgi:hypothetical protein
MSQNERLSGTNSRLSLEKTSASNKDLLRLRNRDKKTIRSKNERVVSGTDQASIWKKLKVGVKRRGGDGLIEFTNELRGRDKVTREALRDALGRMNITLTPQEWNVLYDLVDEVRIAASPCSISRVLPWHVATHTAGTGHCTLRISYVAFIRLFVFALLT